MRNEEGLCSQTHTLLKDCLKLKVQVIYTLGHFSKYNHKGLG